MNIKEKEELTCLFIEKQKSFESMGEEGERFLNAYLFQLDRIDSTHQLRNFFCKIGRKRTKNDIKELKQIKKAINKELKSRYNELRKVEKQISIKKNDKKMFQNVSNWTIKKW